MFLDPDNHKLHMELQDWEINLIVQHIFQNNSKCGQASAYTPSQRESLSFKVAHPTVMQLELLQSSFFTI